jgi:HJR/Mrr/RecB family endonuclease
MRKKSQNKNKKEKQSPEWFQIGQVVFLSVLLVFGGVVEDIYMLLYTIGFILLAILIDLKLSH